MITLKKKFLELKRYEISYHFICICKQNVASADSQKKKKKNCS